MLCCYHNAALLSPVTVPQEVEQMATAKAYLEKQHGKQVVMLLGQFAGHGFLALPSQQFPMQQQQH